jgi:hypothetical protein
MFPVIPLPVRRHSAKKNATDGKGTVIWNSTYDCYAPVSNPIRRLALFVLAMLATMFVAGLGPATHRPLTVTNNAGVTD